MKKLSRKNKLYHTRVTIKRTRRKYRSKKNSKTSPKLSEVYSGYVAIAPKVFDISSKHDRKNLMFFIRKMNSICKHDKKTTILDFTNTTHMVSGGTLLFRAHLCKLMNDNPEFKIKIRLSKEIKINQVLKQIGALELLGQYPNIDTDHPDVVNWRYAQGAGALGEKYEEILGHYDGAITPALSERLYLGLTEAMTNTRHHAYPDTVSGEEHISSDGNEWWMFSQEKDGNLYVVFCDLGMGIPASLPNKKPSLWAKITKRFGTKPKDSKVISEAIKHSQSRTKLEYRGKGLKQLTGILEQTEGGGLHLFSNYGCYTSANGGVSLSDQKVSINGTLIAWSMPI